MVNIFLVICKIESGCFSTQSVVWFLLLFVFYETFQIQLDKPINLNDVRMNKSMYMQKTIEKFLSLLPNFQVFKNYKPIFRDSCSRYRYTSVIIHSYG